MGADYSGETVMLTLAGSVLKPISVSSQFHARRSMVILALQ